MITRVNQGMTCSSCKWTTLSPATQSILLIRMMIIESQCYVRKCHDHNNFVTKFHAIIIQILHALGFIQWYWGLIYTIIFHMFINGTSNYGLIVIIILDCNFIHHHIDQNIDSLMVNGSIIIDDVQVAWNHNSNLPMC